MAIKRQLAKRTSTSGTSGDAKKRRTVQKQCDAVRDAVLSAEDFPEKVLKMVANNLSDCLAVPKEDRHGYQETVIGFAGEVLQSVEAGIKTSIADAESKRNSASTEKEARDQAAADAIAAVTSKTEALDAAKEALAGSQAASKAAKAAVSEAETAQQTGDQQLEEATGRKAKLESALNDAYAPLKEGSVAGPVAQGCITTLAKLGKEFPFDSSMLASLPSALSKSPGERGSFDGMVLQQLEDELKKQIASLEDILSNGESSKAERASKVEETKAAFESAKAHEASCKGSVEQSTSDLSEAKAAKKAAKTAVDQFGADMKQVEKDLAAAQASLRSFNEQASAAYKELLEYTAAQPDAPAEEQAEGTAA